MKKGRKIDIFLLILFPILAVILSFFLKLNFLFSTILFFGLPGLWLSYRDNKLIKKSLLFAVIFSIPLTFIIDYIIVSSKGWYIVDTIFSIRLFNIVALEQFIWGFLYVYFVIIFYEYFLDNIKKGSIQLAFFRLFNKKENIFDKRMKRFSFFLLFLFVLFFTLALMNPIIFNINDSYLRITLLTLISAVVFLVLYPHFLLKFIKITIYFCFLAILVEFVGIKMNYWFFPATSKFLGWFTILGFSMPLEEFFFYFIVLPSGVLSYYEFFHDDRK